MNFFESFFILSLEIYRILKKNKNVFVNMRFMIVNDRGNKNKNLQVSGNSDLLVVSNCEEEETINTEVNSFSERSVQIGFSSIIWF